MTELSTWIEAVLAHHQSWEAEFPAFQSHDALAVRQSDFTTALGELTSRLEDNYPFFHPRYVGQMQKPPHPAAVAGYLASMLINPNNHALDGGPATAEMEKEATRQLAAMFGFERDHHLGHLTSSGTIANLEALFVARELHPEKGIAFSAEAHYTHSRMCHLLGVEAFVARTDDRGRIDLDQVDELARSGKIGTVVLTAGSTGLGAIDRIDAALDLRERYGLRVHVDGAYGGFFTILGRDPALSESLSIDPRPWQAIANCDSVVVDPHKHGLQPYGCGAVLFADPKVARYYFHDSPYTYYTVEEGGSRHLGEISLECSRAGAAAAALWLTLRLFPLVPSGLGKVLAATRRAALKWSSLIASSPELSLYQPPELDIVAYFPDRENPVAVDQASAAVFESGMAARNPVFMSLLKVSATELARRHGRFRQDAVTTNLDTVRILRSVLMKPESEDYADVLVGQIGELAQSAR